MELNRNRLKFVRKPQFQNKRQHFLLRIPKKFTRAEAHTPLLLLRCHVLKAEWGVTGHAVSVCQWLKVVLNNSFWGLSGTAHAHDRDWTRCVSSEVLLKV